MNIPPEKQKRYDRLTKLRLAEVLSEKEHQELILLSNEREACNVARMPFIFQLAAHRQVKPELLIQQLDAKK